MPTFVALLVTAVPLAGLIGPLAWMASSYSTPE